MIAAWEETVVVAVVAAWVLVEQFGAMLCRAAGAHFLPAQGQAASDADVVVMLIQTVESPCVTPALS